MIEPKGLQENSIRKVLGMVFLPNVERHLGGSAPFPHKTLCL